MSRRILEAVIITVSRARQSQSLPTRVVGKCLAYRPGTVALPTGLTIVRWVQRVPDS